MKDIVWFARGGGIAKAGPFDSQIEAWEAMEYTHEMKERTGYKHPHDTAVWPERCRQKR